MTANEIQGAQRSWMHWFRGNLKGSRYFDETEIDELAAEVEAHCADSGEPEEKAFGSPDEYANRVIRERVPAVGKESRTVRRGSANPADTESETADHWLHQLEELLVDRHGIRKRAARKVVAKARSQLRSSTSTDPDEEFGPVEQYATEAAETAEPNTMAWLRMEITLGVVAAFQLASFALNVGDQPDTWTTWSYLGIGIVCAVVSVYAYRRDHRRRRAQ